MQLAVMVEGQEGVGWDDWLALARTAEDHGYQALLRSDHYFSVAGEAERGALDAWATINALAAVTERIRLGTLVSPVTFRPPAILAKLALTADHVSGGRIDVGMGTGWWAAEHETYGFAFPPMRERMDELERQLGEVTRLWAETPPAPVQSPHPRIVLGGQAKARSAALAARYAAEYNMLFADPGGVRERSGRLRAACEAGGRDPSTLALSLMTGFVVGEDAADVRRRAERLMAWRGETGDPQAWLRARASEDSWLVGTPAEVVERLEEYADAGVRRVALQHHLFTDLEVLELIARDVMPHVSSDL
jgi:alkanesulfonate monooxygenase SsuD/methylene tetrahydromethanopterin reductase-like flavin-dependent oxidoreductase (luciferase family)